jgi:hypothetical protein
MSEREVRNLQRDLDEGHIEELVEQRLTQLDAQRVCPVCGSNVGRDGYELSFGTGIRMKARFDARDCLQHFIENGSF